MDNTTSMNRAEFTARRSLPMMALRGLTVFPGMMLTFEVERSMSIAALNMAMSDDQIIYLVPQKDIATDIPTPDDVYGVGHGLPHQADDEAAWHQDHPRYG